jgi:hypothetical protein
LTLTKLETVIQKSRAAILSRTTSTAQAALTESLSAAPLTKWQQQNRAENAARAAALTLQRPTEPPLPRMLAIFPDAATVQAERKLSKGAAILWAYLHHLALSVAAERGYQIVAGRVVFHLTLGALALRLGYTERHLYRLCVELEKAGLIQTGAHAQRVGFRKMFDGCLWAIKMTATGPAPRIEAEEWRHVWRPDFAEDYAGKTGEVAKMSDLLSQQGQPEKTDQVLRRMAAKTGSKNPPLSSSDIFGGGIENAVTDGLRVLMLLHTPKRRAAEVARLASLIVKALGDTGRFRQWCSVLWAMIRDENELKPAVEAFILQFQRILTDIHEGAPWKSAGAVLMARWKGTAA